MGYTSDSNQNVYEAAHVVTEAIGGMFPKKTIKWLFPDKPWISSLLQLFVNEKKEDFQTGNEEITKDIQTQFKKGLR